MYSGKLKIITILFLAVLGYLLISAVMFLASILPSITDFVASIYQDPVLILSPENLWLFVILILAISVGIFILYRCLQVIYCHLREGTEKQKTVGKLDRQKKSLEVFMEVAQKEFMKRKISKQTFEDIQRLAGKRMVEIKAKRKELEDRLDKVEEIIRDGNDRARAIARETMAQVREAVKI